jgi:hypothetical protein
LLNIKRLAYEIAPVANRFEGAGSAVAAHAPSEMATAGITAAALSRRIETFLGSRGYRRQDTPERVGTVSAKERPTDASTNQAPLEFVCEEDVRLAIQTGRKLVVAERAIVTPAARDLAEEHHIFTVAPWRG